MKRYLCFRMGDNKLHLYKKVEDDVISIGQQLIAFAGEEYTATIGDFISCVIAGFIKEDNRWSVKLLRSEIHNYQGMNYSFVRNKLYYDLGEVSESFIHRETYDENEYQKLINPFPKEVLDIIEIMKKFGDYWKDDCEQHHLDDVDIYKAAEEIFKYFKPKEEVKEIETKAEPNKESVEVVESFEQIVKKRKNANEYKQSFRKLDRKWINMDIKRHFIG